jgi:hypothetical protein
MRRMPVAAIPVLALVLLPGAAFAEGESGAALSPGSTVHATDPLVEALTGLAGAALGVEVQPPATPPSTSSGGATPAAPAGTSTIVVKVAPASGETTRPETSEASPEPAENPEEGEEADAATTQPAIVVKVAPGEGDEAPQTAAKEGEESSQADPAPKDKAAKPPAIVVHVIPADGQTAGEQVVQIESSAQGQVPTASAPATEQTSSSLTVKLIVAAINVAVLLLAALLV